MSEALRRITETHLQELVQEVWAGRCVAFVGAGFSAAARLPGWESLLASAAREVPPTHAHRATIDATLGKAGASHRELEAAAQLIQDAVGAEGFREAVTEALTTREPLHPQYLERRRLLKQVPFRGILTTNFDPLLPGHLPSAAGYRVLLRDDAGGPWSTRYWPGGDGPQVMQLHGAVGTKRLVFARRDYRDLLFGDPGYLTFLRSLFATKTVLFMGFSFRDAYIDLLRAELMSLVDKGDDTPSTAFGYSIMTDVSEAEVAYYRKHEGLRVLWFERTDDFSGLDTLLRRLAEATNPLLRLRTRLRGARVLWLDPQPDNNIYAMELLGGADRLPVVVARSLAEARRELAGAPYDLVLSHWGHRPGQLSVAQELLQTMQSAGHRVPVVVFGDPEHAEANRRQALRWGAFELTASWTELFRAVDSVLPGGQSTRAGREAE